MGRTLAPVAGPCLLAVCAVCPPATARTHAFHARTHAPTAPVTVDAWCGSEDEKKLLDSGHSFMQIDSRYASFKVVRKDDGRRRSRLALSRSAPVLTRCWCRRGGRRQLSRGHGRRDAALHHGRAAQQRLRLQGVSACAAVATSPPRRACRASTAPPRDDARLAHARAPRACRRAWMRRFRFWKRAPTARRSTGSALVRKSVHSVFRMFTQ